MVPIRQPLVLITQIPRSGGTMLMRAFDGHPELWSIPHEWGTPLLAEFNGDPWTALYDPKTGGRNENGFRQSKSTLSGELTRYEFKLDPARQERLFRKQLAAAQGDPRRMHEAFLGAYFGAWRNYANRKGDKRWVTAFAPRLLLASAALQNFDRLYPDGRVISVVRDPASWYASARLWSPEWQDIDIASAYWTRGVEAALKWERLLEERMLIVSFERLVCGTEAQMRKIAFWLDIDYRDSLATPTFNREPIKANSSFQVEKEGVISAAAHRGDLLSPEERNRIHELTSATYGRLLSAIGVRSPVLNVRNASE